MLWINFWFTMEEGCANTSEKIGKTNVGNLDVVHGHPIIESTNETYINSVLDHYTQRINNYHLGLPYDMQFYYKGLRKLQNFPINNVGDPFMEGNFKVHSRDFERGVLDWVSQRLGLQKNEYWGYITSSEAEGNLHGILVGREKFPEGVLYASLDSHSSIFKAAIMYKMQLEKVDTLKSGEMDYNDFKQKLLKGKDKPAIVSINVGTPMDGAVDDLDKVLKVLNEAGFNENMFYIHCDCSFFGLMTSIMKHKPKVSFKKPIESVSLSGFSFIGCPIPCGIQITRTENINFLSKDIEYIFSKDATITGGRNGHAPIHLWYLLNKKGFQGVQRDIQTCLELAKYLTKKLEVNNINTQSNNFSNIVVFEKPTSEAFVNKWQLQYRGKTALFVVLPKMSIHILDLFVMEFIQVVERC